MITLTIPGKPVPWTASRITKRGAFDPKLKEKQSIRWRIKTQYNGNILDQKVSLAFTFYMPVPKSFAKKTLDLLKQGKIIYHDKKPDLTNLQKLYEDCLKGIVIKDDNQVVEVFSRKIFSLECKTKIEVQSLDMW